LLCEAQLSWTGPAAATTSNVVLCLRRSLQEGTCEILDALREFDSNAEIINAPSRLASTLQKHHVSDSERFRSCMINNPKVMLQLLEWSTEHPRTVHTGMDVCDHHLKAYFTRTEPGDPCQWCHNDERPTQRYNMRHVRCD
jgi:hypothetical protein